MSVPVDGSKPVEDGWNGTTLVVPGECERIPAPFGGWEFEPVPEWKLGMRVYKKPVLIDASGIHWIVG